jgi:hypothetical protein
VENISKKEECIMKYRLIFLAVLMLFVSAPCVQAQEFGKMRALQLRAAHVVKQKNDFVARVLTSYAIAHERNAQGAVVRINMDGHWLDVSSIEIVPVLKEGVDKRNQVTAHELFFFTTDGILDLLSDLIIR